MKVAGHNVLAILAAAIVMYLVEFMIYGVLVPAPVYQHLAGLNAGDAQANLWKMPFGLLGPLVWAAGLSLANRWRGAATMGAGAMTGLLTAVFFMLSARFYQWAYGATGLDFFALDAAHFLVVGAIGGAILAGWPWGRSKAT